MLAQQLLLYGGCQCAQIIALNLNFPLKFMRLISSIQIKHEKESKKSGVCGLFILGLGLGYTWVQSWGRGKAYVEKMRDWTEQKIVVHFKSNGAPQLSLTKYFCDRFLRVSLTNFFSRWLGYLDVDIAKNLQNCMSQIYSTRLHASFGNLTQWQHLNNLLWFNKRGKCQWNSRGLCHIFATIFAKQILAAKIFGQWKSGDYYWSQIVWLGKTSHVTYNIQSECCIANYSTL